MRQKLTAPGAFSPGLSAALAALSLTAGCEGCGDVLNPVAPRISVDVCTKPEKEPTQECELAFGSVDITVATEKKFRITNPSGLELKFIETDGDDGEKLPGIRFDTEAGDGDFEFISTPPASIGPGLTVEVGVRIRPQFETSISRDIIILSDANNVAKELNEDNGEIRIPVTLTGVDNGVPDIEIIPDPSCGGTDPLLIDFDSVAVNAAGGGAACEVVVNNRGTRDLIFDHVAFVPNEDGSEVDEPSDSDPVPGLRVTNPPGSTQPLGPTSPEVAPLTLRVVFKPDVLGRFAGVLRFETSDPDEPVIDVPVVGVGATEPTCDARVIRVNNEPVSGAPIVEPLDDVVLFADASSSVAGGSIVGYEWTLVEAGPGSGAVLTNPSGQETQFSFANRRGVDVAGPYRACVVVEDNLGTKSVDPCCVSFSAVPQESFLVQLTWVGEQSDDMDLHVAKLGSDGRYCVASLGGGGGSVDPPFREGGGFGGGEGCGDDDCGYYNCRVEGAGIEWDGAAGRTAGDPSLDIDDTNGFGPENINVDQAVAGSYAFGASFFGGGVPVSMFMRLFLFGQLQGEWVETVQDDFWEVGIVHFSEDDPFNPCVEDLTDGDATDDCPGFPVLP